MTPDEEKRLQKIEERTGRSASRAGMHIGQYTDELICSDIPWLIARYRETDAHLHGKGGEAE